MIGMQYAYPYELLLQPEGGFTVIFRDVPEAITKKASAGSPSFTISLPKEAETGTKLSATTRRSSSGIIWRRGRESRTSRPSPGAALPTHAPRLGQFPLDRLERTRGGLVPDVALGMGPDHGIALGRDADDWDGYYLDGPEYDDARVGG